MLHRIAVALFLPLVLSGGIVGQVALSVPSSTFHAGDRIQAKVTNRGRVALSYCVEFGQSSPHGETVESTPIPFYIERRGAEKWGVLLIGPDVGSSRHPVRLAPSDSQEFPFRMIDKGDMRLVLYYWVGERDDVCDEAAKGKKTARSKTFLIVAH